MPHIYPVSDLRNYGSLLEEVSYGSPVYLTRNGRGAYVIRDIKEDEKLQKASAMLQLLSELNAGLKSGREEGWISHENLLKEISSWAGEES